MSSTAQMLVDDRYRLVQPLGQGGMGRVWKARDETLGRDVAIKEVVPPPGLSAAERAEVRDRAMREARAVARLNNPGVVRIHDVISTDDGDPWIVMEYLPGGSLHDLLARNGTLPVAQAARIGLDLLGALRATHSVGIVHRDIKPANVLISEDGRAVLTDFGIASVPGDPFVTRTGLLLGSPAYLAPERVKGGKAGPEADVWSLGATLFAAVEGSPPFARANTMETLAALATEPVPDPKRAGPLTPVLKGLLRKDPQARMSTAEAQRLLGAIAAGEAPPVPAFAPGRAAPRPKPSPTPETRHLPEAQPRPRPRPQPQPQASPRRTGRALLLFILVATGLLAAALAFDNRTAPEGSSPPASSPARQPQASSAAPTPAPSPSSVASPSPSGFVLPAGWQMQSDGTGFRVPVPDGWEFGRDEDGRAFWRDPRSGALLLIDQRRDPQPDPVQDWLKNESARKSGYRNYQRIRIEEVSYWDKAADWEFTYVSRSGNRLHVLNRGFITAPDQAYSIYWSTAASQWDSLRDDLQVVFDGFIPARS